MNRPTDPLVGQTLAGRFRVLELIDRGGMGKIFRAEQQPLGRIVALKTLDIVDNTGEFKQRFLLEAASCARLSHPNTVRVYDYGEAAGAYFLVMEFLTGRTLHQAIKEDAPLDPLRAIAIARQICGALEEAHKSGIVHRDLKPQNIFLTEHGEERDFVKVVDFGLAKEMSNDSEVSKAGNVLGSPMYMAPEQVEGKTIDARTDVYALGLILYTMLAGQTPYKRGDSLSIMMQQVHKEPLSFAELDPKLDIAKTLEQVVRTAINKDPNDRFASMRDLSQALKVAGAQVRGEFPPTPLEINNGRVRAPAGLEPTEEVSRSGRRIASEEDTSQHSLVRSMARPAAIGVVSLGAFGLLGVSLLAALSLVAAVVVFWPANPPAARPVAAVVVAATPASTPLPPPQAPAAPARVHLDSTPPGAEVMEDNVVIGHTPLDLDVTIGTPRTFALAAIGRTPKTVRLDGSAPAMVVDLPKIARIAPTAGAPTAPIATPPVSAPPVSTVPAAPPPAFEPKHVSDVKNPFH